MPYAKPAPFVRVAAALLLPLLFSVPSALAADETQQAGEIELLKQQLRDLQARVERLENRRETVFSFDTAPEVEPVPGGWRKVQNWGLLREGMTSYQVRAVLGAPDRQKTVKKFEFWYYGDGKATVYLDRLKDWEMPSGLDGG